MKISTGRLRELVDKAGYSFAEFARDVGVSKEAIRVYTDLKVSVAPIRPENLRKIAEKLGVPLDDLRVRENGESPDPFAELEALAARHGLTDEEVIAHFSRRAASKLPRPKPPALAGLTTLDQLDQRSLGKAASQSEAARKKAQGKGK